MASLGSQCWLGKTKSKALVSRLPILQFLCFTLFNTAGDEGRKEQKRDMMRRDFLVTGLAQPGVDTMGL